MNRKNVPIWMGALVGAIITLPLIALMYLGQKLLGQPFPPYEVFNWFSGMLPGPVITFGIDLMIDTMLLLGINVANSAKIAEQGMAVLIFYLSGIIAGGVLFLILNRLQLKVDLLAGMIMGILFGLPVAVISIGDPGFASASLGGLLWFLILFLGWGITMSLAYSRLLVVETPLETEGGEVRSVEVVNRRQFLILLGGAAAAITVVGAGLGTLLNTTGNRRQDENLSAHAGGETGEGSFPNANDPVSPVPVTRPEYTPLKDHYQVFIELEPTEIDGETWQLPITGLVGNTLMLTLDDLRNNYQARDQFVTLSCISGRVGTSLIGTTLWTGASLQEVLADADVSPQARYLYIASGDGFYETVDLDLVASDERIMLCYDWDGHPLTVEHGFPLRIWYPDRFGMKQPKWITSIEVTDEYREGYWVERGWDEIAQVKATSVVDTVAVDAIIENEDQRLVPIGGIAFSGDRGISKVEVRVDGGPWESALLRSPLSETTWVIWRFEWPFEAGDHTFEVRCAEEDGTPQIEEIAKSRPSGATGIHSRDATL
jgi:DMSO/TMAO reductase YedYZ molybdopterin-dependent catalytic subunit